MLGAGLTWSRSTTTKSRYVFQLIQAFKFKQGDTILIKVDFGNKKIVFKMKNETYTLSIDQEFNDPLFPCVCFHYAESSVALLPDHDFEY